MRRQPLQKSHLKHADWHRRRRTSHTVCFDLCDFSQIIAAESREVRPPLTSECVLCESCFYYVFLLQFFQFDALFASKINFGTIWFPAFDALQTKNSFPGTECGLSEIPVQEFYSIHSMLKLIVMQRNAHTSRTGTCAGTAENWTAIVWVFVVHSLFIFFDIVELNAVKWCGER